MKHYIAEMVRKLDEAGINAVIFQIRPEADAFYKSDLEPWSRFLTGRQGQAPDDPNFDPLAFIIDECHKRGMELHAWLNPYRVKTNINNKLAPNHIYWQYPERFIQYGTQLFFDPGLPENREFICRVVKDIVSRYDVDAIHMDDYFYPYPIAGKPFPDDESFNKYAALQGFSQNQREDWRRNNVNLLIQQIKYTIAATKPWVRFGISPFGIYRNKKNTPDGSGSETNGLENYGDLYADIQLWVKKGWVDYNLPQLYWEIGHKNADYPTLLNWWNANSFDRPLYIGKVLKPSTQKKEPPKKIPSTGRCLFGGGRFLFVGFFHPKKEGRQPPSPKQHPPPPNPLPPPTPKPQKRAPDKVKNLSEVFTEDMHFLTWDHKKQPDNPEAAQYFVVYRFRKGEKSGYRQSRKHT